MAISAAGPGAAGRVSEAQVEVQRPWIKWWSGSQTPARSGRAPVGSRDIGLAWPVTVAQPGAALWFRHPNS